MTTPPSVPPAAAPPPPPHDPMDASVGQLFGEVTRDLSTLIRQEVALAKAEATESAKKAGTGAGLLGGAAWAAHFVLLFLSLTLWWVLGALLGEGDREPALGWAALIVTLIWAVIAAVLALRGKKELQKTKGLPQTADSLKKIPDALKGQERS
ncbi:phage holin family protein [Sanguibacter biliveldensis]